MKYWTLKVPQITKAEITKYCTNNCKWIRFRQKLIGLSTEAKLTNLERWLANHNRAHSAQVQVAHYIHILVRSGKLQRQYRIGPAGMYQVIYSVK